MNKLIRIYLQVGILLGFSMHASAGVEPVTPSPSTSFIPNVGQVHDQHDNERTDIRYSCTAGNLSYHFSDRGFSMTQFKTVSWKDIGGQSMNSTNGDENLVPDEVQAYRVDVNLVNSNSDVALLPKTMKAEKLNFYNVSDPNGLLGVNTYESIAYEKVYEGVDMLWYGVGNALEYDFVVAPRADPYLIRMELNGATRLSVNEEGALVVETPFGDIVQNKPIAYQDDMEVEVSWLVSGNTLSFALGEYDPSKKLTIDPIVRIWGTYYGHSGYDIILHCTSDNLNNIYVSGVTNSNQSMATSGSHMTTFSGVYDAFVAKFDVAGNRSWGTYYGSAGDDNAWSCAVDNVNNMIYVAGVTNSSSGISTTGSHQESLSGTTDGYLVKFNSSGVRQWGTYVGGTDNDYVYSVAIASNGDVYLCGETFSTDGLVTVGAHQEVHQGGDEAFLNKFNSNGVRLWGTYYGGDGTDYGLTCNVDKLGNVYLVGDTYSSSGISTAGAHQTSISSGRDGYLAKFSSSGVRLFGTYYGGDATDRVRNCMVDNIGNIYLAGFTYSFTNIATSGSWSSTYSGDGDAFLVKLNASGNRLWGTYFGSTGFESVGKSMLGNDEKIYLLGESYSSNSIATSGTHQSSFGGIRDGYIARFDNNGNLGYCTYLGGPSEDFIWAGAVRNNTIVVGGLTKSSTGISTAGAHQTNYNSDYDGMLVRFCQNSYDTLEVEACESYETPQGNEYFSSGLYTELYENVDGCDSVMVYDLDIDEWNEKPKTASACVEYEGLSGKIYTATGNYNDTVPASSGCGTIWKLNLTIETLDTIVINDGFGFTAMEANCTYQWVKCENGILTNVPGATSQSFTPTENGSYAVILQKESCSFTTPCREFGSVGIGELGNGAVTLYPNPSDGMFTINLPANSGSTQVCIYDAMGRLVYNQQHPQGGQILVDTPLVQGAYTVKVSNDELSTTLQLIQY